MLQITKLEIVKREMENYKLDMIKIYETRWQKEEFSNEIVYDGCNQDNGEKFRSKAIKGKYEIAIDERLASCNMVIIKRIQKQHR